MAGSYDKEEGPRSWSGDGAETVISLADEEAVDLGRIRDGTSLLLAIPASLPEDCVLYLESRSLAEDVRALIERHAVEPVAHVARGTTWPRPAFYHVPATHETLAELARLSSMHAVPEACDHLVVYRGDRVLLTAYD